MLADVPAWVLLPLLGGLIRLVCVAPTVLATWRGEDSPSLVSWSVWTATTGLGAATSVAAGEPVAAAVPAAAFIQCSTMFGATLASRWRHPDKRTRATGLDWTCLTLCICTGAVWAVALLLDRGDPATATLIATIVLCAATATDGIASGPTWRRARHGEESWLLWTGAAATPALTLLVLGGGAVATWVYPSYELTLCAGIAALTMWRRRRGVAAATLGTALGLEIAVVTWQAWSRGVAPGTLWITLFGAVIAVAVAVVITARAWAIARRQQAPAPLVWAAMAVAAVAALIVQVRMGVAPFVVQAVVLAYAFTQIAVVAVLAWLRPAPAATPPPAHPPDSDDQPWRSLATWDRAHYPPAPPRERTPLPMPEFVSSLPNERS